MLLITSLFATCFNLIIVTLVLLKNKHTPLNRAFSGFVLSLSLWIFGDYVQLTSLIHLCSPLFWVKMAHIGAVFTPFFLMTFVYHLNAHPKNKKWTGYLLASALIFIADMIKSRHFIQSVTLKNTTLITEIGPLYYLFLINVLGVLFYSCYLLIKTYKKTHQAQQKAQIRYFFFATSAILIATLFYFPTLIWGINLRLDNLFLSLFIGIIAYSITKQKLMDISVVISKTAAYVTTLILYALVWGLSLKTILYFTKNLPSWFIFAWSLLLTIVTTLTHEKIKLHLITTTQKLFLKGKYNYKKALIQLSSELGNAGQLDEIVNILNHNFLNNIEIYPIYVFFPEGYTERRDISSHLLYAPSSSKETEPIPALSFNELGIESSNEIIKVLKKEQGILITKQAPESIKAELKDNKIEALIPCFNQNGDIIALIMACKKLSGDTFNDDDIDLFTSISATLPPILQRIKEARVSAEMDVAQRIQLEILPKSPTLPRLELSCHMNPADEVGGDYYDVYNFEGQNWIVLGDVAGHGVGSGLVMFMVQSIMASLIYSNPKIAPNDLNYNANKILCKNFKRLLDGGRPITILTLKSTDSRTFEISGSHDNFYIYRSASNTIEEKKVEHFPFGLGFDEDLPKDIFELDTITLEKNDILLLITDGITEAFKNGLESEEQYGEKRLKALLVQHHDKPVEEIKSLILADLDAYTQKIYFDDVTFILAKAIE